MGERSTSSENSNKKAARQRLMASGPYSNFFLSVMPFILVKKTALFHRKGPIVGGKIRAYSASTISGSSIGSLPPVQRLTALRVFS